MTWERIEGRGMAATKGYDRALSAAGGEEGERRWKNGGPSEGV